MGRLPHSSRPTARGSGVVRPLSGVVALLPFAPKDDEFDTRERLAVAFFGVRGVGSLFYLAYATSHGDFGDHDALWATVGFTVTASVLLHGITATPWLRRLDLRRTS
jgi:NhaP-type Na+/H+ or K+/H+ antiporter